MGHETSQRELLEAAYSTLGYNEGEFISVQEEPATWTQEQWLEKGEWLSLAKQVGAEKIFFVKNNPVIIFATCEADETAAMRLFNRVWCMSRPALLYIAKPGELAVYSLSQPPVTSQVELAKRPFSIASNVAEVAQKFQEFRREQVESGNLFGDERFASLNHRADQLLINDLRTVRKGLMEAGLAGENLKYAHALIGRSIFIRYLEDRGILTDDYFKQAAKDNSHWLALLEQPLSLLSEDLEANNSQFVRVLSDHQFTDRKSVV